MTSRDVQIDYNDKTGTKNKKGNDMFAMQRPVLARDRRERGRGERSLAERLIVVCIR
jgi:hypothetical protein